MSISRAKRVTLWCELGSKVCCLFWRIYLDVLELNAAYNNYRHVFVFKDEYLGAIFVVIMPNKTGFFETIEEFEVKIRCQWGLLIYKFRLDWETILISLA